VLNLLDLEWVDEIALNLPRRFGRNQAEYTSIPDYVLSYEKVRIHWSEKDDGPIMKILQTIEREKSDGDTICISIDDDIAMPRNLVKSLITASIAFDGRAAVGTKGAKVKSFLSQGPRSQQAQYFDTLWPQSVVAPLPVDGTVALDLIEGYGGVAYRSKHLQEKPLREMASCDKKCFQSDDIVLNMHMQQNGVARMRVEKVHVHPLSFGNQEDALHIMQNHYEAYGKCIDHVNKK
jgi:hypothetical protein